MHEVNYLTKPIYEIHEFPEHLARNGHEIAFWHFPEGSSLEQARSLGWRREIGGRAVFQSSLTLFTPPFSGSLTGRLVTAILAHHLAKRILREFKPELIVCFSVPTHGWQVIRAARNIGVPVIFRALDVSHKIRRGLFSALTYWSETFVYKNASWISANNPAMLEYCQSMGANPVRSSVDWPPLDLRRFKEAKPNPGLKEQLGIPDNRKIILYMGTFFYFSGLPEVIKQFAKSALDEHLILIGGGEQDAELRELVENFGIQEKVTFTGFVGFDELPSVLKIADVAINPMLPSLVANAALPNKVIQYLASGRVVVSTRLRGLELTFNESNALHLVDSPKQVAEKAMEICRGTVECANHTGIAEVERFSLPKAIKVFRDRCREVAANA